jgi:hypothetical protein
MVHYSKKDTWLIGLISLVIVVPFALGIVFFLIGTPYKTIGLALSIDGVVTCLVVFLLCYPLYYEITLTELIVRCGLLVNRRIPLTSIEGVQPDRNPASAPAWSLDRLRIDYLQDGQSASVLISPADKAAFMQELMAAGLKMQGDRLVRESSFT